MMMPKSHAARRAWLPIALLALAACANPVIGTDPESPWLPPVPPAPTNRPPVTDGDVRCLVASGTTVYAGGDFSLIGPLTGKFSVTGAASGKPDLGMPVVDSAAADGAVHAIEPDGRGGWYIGGKFDTVGGLPRACLAHILPDGSVSDWNPGLSAPATGFVNSLSLSGGLLYLGGTFTAIGGVARANLAAVDAADGAVAAWNPGANGPVSALVADGATVHVGGTFTSAGGAARTNLACIDAVNGSATAWIMNATGGAVEALLVDGTTLYLAGAFTAVGGQARNRAASTDLVTGALNAWNPNCNGAVRALGISGGRVYLGGAFSAVSGAPRSRLAAVDAATGVLAPWDPGCGGEVWALALSGGRLYAGGSFESAGGCARDRVAAFDPGSGVLLSWESPANGAVRALEAGTAGALAVGGEFTGIGMERRRNLASFDAVGGQILAFRPDPDGTVRAMAVGGGAVFAGGDFLNAGGRPRTRVAGLDPASGKATAFSATADDTVLALALDDGMLYLGGEFLAVGHAGLSWAIQGAASVDARTGEVSDWSPGTDGTVRAFAIRGRQLFLGGDFLNVTGPAGAPVARSRLACFDLDSGLADGTWNPAASGPVHALAVCGSSLAVGGLFATVAGATRTNVALVSADSVTVSAWAWNATGGMVSAFSAEAGMLYAAGAFTSFAGTAGLGRHGSARLDDGGAGTWRPVADAAAYASAAAGGRIWTGGSFAQLGGKSRSSIAAVAPDGTVW